MKSAAQAGLRDRLEAEERTEQWRVSVGIRRPPEWVTRRVNAGQKHEGQVCRGCFERITVGERITIERDVNCAIEARRYRYWHRDCHPRAVERAFNALRRQYIRAGGRVAP